MSPFHPNYCDTALWRNTRIEQPASRNILSRSPAHTVSCGCESLLSLLNFTLWYSHSTSQNIPYCIFDSERPTLNASLPGSSLELIYPAPSKLASHRQTVRSPRSRSLSTTIAVRSSEGFASAIPSPLLPELPPACTEVSPRRRWQGTLHIGQGVGGMRHPCIGDVHDLRHFTAAGVNQHAFGPVKTSYGSSAARRTHTSWQEPVITAIYCDE
ncbi:hypothetical protein OH77DRAFT_1524153 [Trametes cingulata]|nr:hypothetical protein OH77DRAFT_1524153 [Trametes cingulata]